MEYIWPIIIFTVQAVQISQASSMHTEHALARRFGPTHAHATAGAGSSGLTTSDASLRHESFKPDAPNVETCANRVTYLEQQNAAKDVRIAELEENVLQHEKVLQHANGRRLQAGSSVDHTTPYEQEVELIRIFRSALPFIGAT